jgi:hypothetical protein
VAEGYPSSETDGTSWHEEGSASWEEEGIRENKGMIPFNTGGYWKPQTGQDKLIGTGKVFV